MNVTLPSDLTQLSPSHRLVLTAIRRRGPISRASLVQQTGLSSASVTNLTRHLLDQGLLKEAGKLRGKKGQPAINLVLRAEAGYVVGVSPTRDVTVVAITDYAGNMIGEHSFPTAARPFGDVAAQIRTAATGILNEIGATPEQILSIGVALPTTFSKDLGSLRVSESISAWKEVNFADQLRLVFDRPVRVENDANAAALCEYLLGNEQEMNSFVYIYLGDGLGSGIIINGTVWRGANGNAGELGAIMPRPGPRPTWGDLRAFLAQQGHPNVTPAQLADIVQTAPDMLAPWIARARGQLAELVYLSTAMLDTDGVVIGGTLPLTILEQLAKGLTACGAQRFDHSRLLVPEIQVSQRAGGTASAVGAATLGLI